MRLNINDSEHLDSPNESDIQRSVEHLGREEFLVLSSEAGYFVQTYHNSDGSFALEHRLGSSEQHYLVDSSLITVDDVQRAFRLFLRQSADLLSLLDWQPLSLVEDVQRVDDAPQIPVDALVEYHGVLMAADWPQEIEDAQEIRNYLMHGQRLSRVPLSAHVGAGEPAGLCQECGVQRAQFHVPGCRHEQCPRCQGTLVECGCQIDVD
jgi:hypothetical protein